MDPDNGWEVFEETGDPLAYLFCRAKERMEAAEELEPEHSRMKGKDSDGPSKVP